MFLCLCFASGDNFPRFSRSPVPAVPQELSAAGGHGDGDGELEPELLWVNASCGDGGRSLCLGSGQLRAFLLAEGSRGHLRGQGFAAGMGASERPRSRAPRSGCCFGQRLLGRAFGAAVPC